MYAPLTHPPPAPLKAPPLTALKSLNRQAYIRILWESVHKNSHPVAVLITADVFGKPKLHMSECGDFLDSVQSGAPQT